MTTSTTSEFIGGNQNKNTVTLQLSLLKQRIGNLKSIKKILAPFILFLVALILVLSSFIHELPEVDKNTVLVTKGAEYDYVSVDEIHWDEVNHRISQFQSTTIDWGDVLPKTKLSKIKLSDSYSNTNLPISDLSRSIHDIFTGPIATVMAILVLTAGIGVGILSQSVIHIFLGIFMSSVFIFSGPILEDLLYENMSGEPSVIKMGVGNDVFMTQPKDDIFLAAQWLLRTYNRGKLTELLSQHNLQKDDDRQDSKVADELLVIDTYLNANELSSYSQKRQAEIHNINASTRHYQYVISSITILSVIILSCVMYLSLIISRRVTRIEDILPNAKE